MGGKKRTLRRFQIETKDLAAVSDGRGTKKKGLRGGSSREMRRKGNGGSMKAFQRRVLGKPQVFQEN